MALLHFFCETVGEMLQAVIISVCFVMLFFPRHIFNFTSGNKNYVISLTTRCPKQVKFARFYRSHVHQFPTVYCTELTSILRIPLSPGPERYTYTVPWVRLSHYPCFLPIKRVDPRTPDWLTSLTSFFSVCYTKLVRLSLHSHHSQLVCRRKHNVQRFEQGILSAEDRIEVYQNGYD